MLEIDERFVAGKGVVAVKIEIHLNPDGTLDIHDHGEMIIWCSQHQKSVQILLTDTGEVQPIMDFACHGGCWPVEAVQPDVVLGGEG